METETKKDESYENRHLCLDVTHFTPISKSQHPPIVREDLEDVCLVIFQEFRKCE